MDDDDNDNGLREIELAARAVWETVHTAAEQMLPPENARPMLIGVAAIMIARNVRDGEQPDAIAVNETWAKEGFPWRMVKSLQ